MAIDLIHPGLEFVGRNVAVVVGKFGVLDLPQKPSGQSIRVGLDEADESVREHHDRGSLPSDSEFPLVRLRGP
jgi:hypothetical protein